MKEMRSERMETERKTDTERESKNGSCLFNSIGNYTTGGMIMTASL